MSDTSKESSFTILPSRGVLNLSPYCPGLSIEEIKEKYNLTNVIKMASNENPLGVSPLAKDAIREYADFAFRYPRSGNPQLLKAIAENHNISTSNIITGNGSDELIDLLIRVFASGKNSKIICFDPCFSIYPIQAQINETRLKKIPLNKDFSFDFEKMADATDENTALVFITTPDNPSGYCPSREEVLGFLKKIAVKAPQALVVIDEAYMEFADEEKNSLLFQRPLPENAVFTRTFSKIYGLAGIRLGYMILPENLAGWLWRARLPFSVNILAEQAGIAALKDEAFFQETLKTVKNGRENLTRQLKSLGCVVFPSSTNFLMFKPPENSLSAASLHERLLQLGIIIRKLESYNLPDFLRVSIGNEKENNQFITAIKKIIATANN